MDLINYCKTTTFFNKTSKRVITYTFANVTLIFRLLHFISHKLHDDKKNSECIRLQCTLTGLHNKCILYYQASSLSLNSLGDIP